MSELLGVTIPMVKIVLWIVFLVLAAQFSESWKKGLLLTIMAIVLSVI